MRVDLLEFGFRTGTLDSLKQLIEEALGVTFEGRESSFHGGLYYRASEERTNLILQINEDLPGEIAEEDFPEMVALFIVDYTSCPDRYPKVMLKLGAELIRTQFCED